MSSICRRFSIFAWTRYWPCLALVGLLAPPARPLRAVEPPAAGVQTVQLDMVIAQMRSDLARKIIRPFLDPTGGQAALDRKGKQAATNPLGTGCTFGEFQEVQNPPGISASPNASPTTPLYGTLNNQAAFLAVLETLREKNLAKVMAEPRLMTLSGRPASFFSGSEQAVPASDGTGRVGVQFEEFGTRIECIPTVLDNGTIHFETVGSSVLPGGTGTRIKTSVNLEAGQTFVLGGLIQKTVTATALKVPILGDLPVLSNLFTTKTYCEEEVETIVLVTPRLVNRAPGEQTAEPCSQEPKTPSASEPNRQENEGSPCKDAAERLRRLDRRLQRLREEIDGLHREIHSLRTSARAPSREP
jgi:hypothetical protein